MCFYKGCPLNVQKVKEKYMLRKYPSYIWLDVAEIGGGLNATALVHAKGAQRYAAINFLRFC